MHKLRDLDRIGRFPKGIGLFFFKILSIFDEKEFLSLLKAIIASQQNKGVRLCLLTQGLMAMFLRN